MNYFQCDYTSENVWFFQMCLQVKYVSKIHYNTFFLTKKIKIIML